MQLAKGTWVLVADGEKYLIYRNEGDEFQTDLGLVRVTELDNPPTREQGTDRPGRMPDPGPGGRSAMEPTDWHRIEKERGLADLAERLDGWARRGRFEALVVIADPRSLGVLRDELSPQVKERVVAEINKDLTNQTVDRIEAALNDA